MGGTEKVEDKHLLRLTFHYTLGGRVIMNTWPEEY
jgi:hypothetical protein